mgnify:CR=1 FL=1
MPARLRHSGASSRVQKEESKIQRARETYQTSGTRARKCHWRASLHSTLSTLSSQAGGLGRQIAAKEQQAHNEGRIQEIEDLIARANVIDVKNLKNEGKVIFGSTVYLIDLDNNEKLYYKIVGKDEANLKEKLIYFQSPIGKGLIGKNKKDLVEINTPAGVKNFEIKDVKYI